ncbi:hypothetical protein [Pseudoprimorskyibacter insulae]|uniref:hypothetical protein n=1 Tax=Pseudoprimorskyibacter insulae TaxID=1695997 RepID=UPI0015E84E74|nr:hypothetical protein [Pseudoprimorskyibacter insulae]
MTSAALAAIFSKIAGREPGPNSWQRLGRAGAVGWMRKDIGASSGNEIADFLDNSVLNYAALRKCLLRVQRMVGWGLFEESSKKVLI